MKKLLLTIVILSTLYYLPHVAAAPRATIQNQSSYISSDSKYIYIVGEVLNTGDVALGPIVVIATLTDSRGIVVDSPTSLADTQYLPPGKRAPFQIIESDPAKISQSAGFTLTGNFVPASKNKTTSLTVQKIATSVDTLGFLNVVGEVHNDATSESKLTEVVGTFYDAQGTVVYVGTAFLDTIPAGQTISFKITVTDSGQILKIKTISVYAESQDYTSIPEWPWPTLMLAAVLSIGTIALRKKSSKPQAP